MDNPQYNSLFWKINCLTVRNLKKGKEILNWKY